MNAWRWIKGRPRWIWPLAGIVVVVVVVTAAVAWSGDGDETTTAGSTTTERSTTTTTTTAPPTTTTTAPPPTTTTAPPAPVPAVAVATARKGGGSGEVAVRWNAVPGATGYRVLRRLGTSGSFDTVADFDITTGVTNAADGVVDIWSEQNSYVPVRNAFQGPDQSPWFEYVDVGDRTQRCYQIVAYNPSGDAPTSTTACASPP